MQRVLQRYKDLQDIIAILGIDELSDEDKLDGRARPQDPALPDAAVLRRRAVHRHRRAATSPIRETVRGFKEILEGKHDALPEQAFYMVGTIDEAVEKGRRPGRGLRTMPLTLEIVTAERVVRWSAASTCSSRPAARGSSRSCRSHAALMTTLDAGELVIFRARPEREPSSPSPAASWRSATTT